MRQLLILAVGYSLFVSSVSAQTDYDIYFARSTDGGTTWSDPNIHVNDTIPGFQGLPCLKVDGNAHVYVTWTDGRNSDLDVYFTKSLDGGFSWTNPNTKVNDEAGGDQGASCHSLDSNGNIYAAWMDRRVPGDADIYFAKSTDDGATWTDPNIEITDPQSWAAMRISLSMDAQGRIYAVWVDERNSNFDVFFAKSVDGGTTWTDPNIMVNDSIPGDQDHAHMVVDSVGNIYVVWKDMRGFRPVIYFSSSTNGGSTWRQPVEVSDSSSSGARWFPTIALDGQENLYVVWFDDRELHSYLFFAKSTDGGAGWTNPNVQVNDTLRTAEVWHTSVGVDSAGNISVVWSEFSEVSGDAWDYNIYFASSADGGLSWTYPNIRINDETTGFQHSPSLDIGPDGIIYVAWQDGRNSVGVAEASTPVPSSPFVLFQNYPNPFLVITTLRYVCPNPCLVKLSIFDVAGHLVRTLVDERQDAGCYAISWDRRDSAGKEVASGVYFYRFVARDRALSGAEVFTATKKMVVLR